MKIIIFVVLALILINSVNAYPFIISEQGTNHTLNKEFVYTFPEKYYFGVDKITFTNVPVTDGVDNRTGKYSINWWKFRNGEIYFFNGYMWIYGKQIKGYGKQQMLETIHHELCHIQGYVKEYKIYNNETYAENCILR